MTEPASLPTAPFVLRMPAAFWWTVRVPVPTDNSYLLATLDLQFRPQPQTRLDQYRGQGLAPGQSVPTEHEICHEVVAGWRHLPDEAGTPQPFSPQALDALLAVPAVRASVVATYLLAMQGLAARKNA